MSKQLFKEGDTVVVRPEIKAHHTYDTIFCERKMRTDKVLTVRKVRSTGNIDCNNGFIYSPIMLEKI